MGEIVGLCVADKREIDYLSGKKLQYKSACYFFRIDREHIVDATQKGGIARFVNHSCLVFVFHPVILPAQLCYSKPILMKCFLFDIFVSFVISALIFSCNVFFFLIEKDI